MVIRKAKKVQKDIDSIYKLITNAARDQKILPRTREDIGDVIDGFFVAVANNKIVGCCAIEVYNKKLAELRSLAVAPVFQRMGIGKMLVDACVESAKEQGVYEILTITDKDVFFEKAGFGKCLNGQWALFMKLK